MNEKKICLISRDEELLRKFQFSFSLVDFESIIISDVHDLMQMGEECPAAVFFDSAPDNMPIFQVAGELRKKWRQQPLIPFILCSYDYTIAKKNNHYAVFDDFLLLPFFRKELYRKLRKFKLLNKNETNFTPFWNMLTNNALMDFMNILRQNNISLLPEYSAVGYVYPKADACFPGDSRDTNNILLKLHADGQLKREIFDRVHQCPQCSGVQINFRECCPKCHSLDFTQTEMLHHFSCGYVGDFAEFQRQKSTDLICPKCNKIMRHIGVDYEKPITAYKCNSCELHFNIAAVRCRCFQCSKEFAPEEAMVQAVYSFSPVEKIQTMDDAEVTGSSVVSNKVSWEMFLLLLRQNYYIAQELCLDIHIVIINSAYISEAERQKILLLLHEYKRPADVVFKFPNGMIIMQVFYMAIEDLNNKIQEFFEAFRQNKVIVSRKRLEFRIHTFRPCNGDSIGAIIEQVGSEEFIQPWET